MRFALIATAAAAAVAVPLAVSAGAPQMTRAQFISDVRCVAYDHAAGARVSEAKWELNAEARRQTAETAALAQSEVSKIARETAQATPGELDGARAAACSGVQTAGSGSQAEA